MSAARRCASTLLALATLVALPAGALARAGAAPECVSSTYHVGVDGAQPTLVDALEDGARSATCGSTIFLPPGRFEIGLVKITRPTTIRGVEGTTLVGTIVNASGVSLALEDLTIADAPFPGALIVSDPDADTTLRNVTVAGATGFGIIDNGGRLVARNSRVEHTRAPDSHDVAPRELGDSLGPAAGSDPQPGRVRFPGRHKLALTFAAHTSGIRGVGSGWMGRVQNALSTVGAFVPIRVQGLNVCSGTGLLLSSGAYAELSDVSFLFNAGAGLAMTGWP